MPLEVTVPRLGWSMDEGTFAEWLIQEGEYVRKGSMLFVLEGDKAAQDIESFDEGFLRLLPESPRPGDKVKVGQVLACLVTADELKQPNLTAGSEVNENSSGRPAESAVTPVNVVSERPAASPAVRRLARELAVDPGLVSGTGPKGRITEQDIRSAAATCVKQDVSDVGTQPVASPRARRRAGELKLDWTRLQGTGRNGRIRERDVLSAQGHPVLKPATSQAPATAGAESSEGIRQPFSSNRRTISRRMLQSHQTTAAVTLTTTADAFNLVNLRNQFRQAMEGADAAVPTFNDFIIKLTAIVLRSHPEMNALRDEDGVTIFSHVHMGVAVDTPHGLFVPVIRNVERLSLRKLAVTLAQQVEKARNGRLSATEMQDGTFTITSLGSFGIDAFTPIINGQQCGILGIGRIIRQPVCVDDQIVAREQMTLSLTFDHRVVDGAPAARFLKSLVVAIENPAQALID